MASPGVVSEEKIEMTPPRDEVPLSGALGWGTIEVLEMERRQTGGRTKALEAWFKLQIKLSKGGEGSEYVIERRYTDLIWLYSVFCDKFPGRVIPPMYGVDTMVNRIQSTIDYSVLETKKPELNKFFSRIIDKPILINSEMMKIFLDPEPDKFEQGKLALPAKTNTAKVFSLVSAGIKDTLRRVEEPDEWFAEKKNYFIHFEFAMNRITRSMNTLAVEQQKCVDARKAFSHAIDQLIVCEERNGDPSHLAHDLLALSQSNSHIVNLEESEISVERCLHSFLSDWILLLSSANNAMWGRTEVLRRVQDLERDLQAKRDYAEKMKVKYRGKADAPPHAYIVQAEKEVTVAEAKLAEGEKELKEVSAGLREDLDAWQITKREEFQEEMLAPFAREKAKSSEAEMEEWRKMWTKEGVQREEDTGK